MTPLTLTLRTIPDADVDASGLTPDRLRGETLDAIRAMSVDAGGRGDEIGALFDVTGDDGESLRLRGDCARLVRVGAAMTRGAITVEGNVGPYAGEAMRGGTIVVEGSAGAYVATGMHHGRIDVRGDVGPYLGGAIAGARTGMHGGTVVVRGNAGDGAGDRMRRGMLLIAGDAGDLCGGRMRAGTIIVLGTTGAEPGLRMQRGSLLLHGRVAVPATFNDSGTHSLDVLRVLARILRAGDGSLAMFAPPVDTVRRYVGDRACDGLGEILAFD